MPLRIDIVQRRTATMPATRSGRLWWRVKAALVLAAATILTAALVLAATGVALALLGAAAVIVLVGWGAWALSELRWRLRLSRESRELARDGRIVTWDAAASALTRGPGTVVVEPARSIVPVVRLWWMPGAPAGEVITEVEDRPGTPADSAEPPAIVTAWVGGSRRARFLLDAASGIRGTGRILRRLADLRLAHPTLEVVELPPATAGRESGVDNS
ncbi:MAG: hypothetical protein AB7G11_01505 [Phycisphaerales bacterium]